MDATEREIEDAAKPGPRFTLKAILGCMTALCVPLALVALGSPFGTMLGWVGIMFALGGCVGFLVRGWDGVVIGAFVGMLITIGLLLAAIILLAGLDVVVF